MPTEKRRLKGEGTIHQRKSDGRWLYIADLGWIGGKRRRKTVSARTLKELRPKIKALNAEVAAGRTDGDKVTLAAWLAYWMKAAELRDTTRRTYAGYIEKWITPKYGTVALADLQTEHVRAIMADMLAADRSPATRKQVLSILSAALELAKQEDKVGRNVCDTVKRPSLADQETHGHLTIEQVNRLLPVLAEHDNRARWLAALVLGLRQGEALALAWEDVHLDDPDGAWLHVHKSQDRQGGRYVRGDVKSAASNRFIPIIEPVFTALVEYREASGGTGLLWGPLDNKTDWKEWRALLAAAGIEPVPVHAARATAATVLDLMGATPRQIADILGHSTVKVAQQHYVASDDPERRAVLAKAGQTFA